MKMKASENVAIETKKIEALKSIEHLLNEIDFSSEVVPTNNVDKLISLITNLKGNELSFNELEVVKEITIHKPN